MDRFIFGACSLTPAKTEALILRSLVRNNSKGGELHHWQR